MPSLRYQVARCRSAAAFAASKAGPESGGAGGAFHASSADQSSRGHASGWPQIPKIRCSQVVPHSSVRTAW